MSKADAYVEEAIKEMNQYLKALAQEVHNMVMYTQISEANSTHLNHYIWSMKEVIDDIRNNLSSNG